MRRSYRSRRAFTTVEFVTASAVTLLIATAMAGMVQFASSTWNRTEAAGSTKQTLAMAVARMEPTLRGALRVNTAQSTSSKLVVVLPRVDSLTGRYRVPLEDGDIVAFYLSNRTGVPAATGSYLWRSVNGISDTAWSLRGTLGPIDVGQNHGLTFAHYTSSGVQSVRFSVTARHESGKASASQTASTEVFLRNSYCEQQ